jgi:hypothetical protein
MGSSRSRRSATNEAMLAISAAEVCAACDKILDRQSSEEPVPALLSFVPAISASAA